MSRTFNYSFIPPTSDPLGTPTISLDASEIEDAGVREVLQTPGAALGTWSVLSALLEPVTSGTDFVFREPLGKAREVKVALSGLFGRFVARACLERYFGISIFAHVQTGNMVLDGRRNIRVERIHRGDLPDWIACDASLSSVVVAEAKGCHDRRGTDSALNRAYAQAERVRLMVGNQPVTFKRYAIVTRWASTTGGVTTPLLAIKDPMSEGRKLTSDEQDALMVGMLRRHFANLLVHLGHDRLSAALINLAEAENVVLQNEAKNDASEALDANRVRLVEPFGRRERLAELVGGIVTRSGPLTNGAVPSLSDQQTLRRLDLRPVFVGANHELLRAIIEGDPEKVRGAVFGDAGTNTPARRDKAGGWIIPLGGDSMSIEKY